MQRLILLAGFLFVVCFSCGERKQGVEYSKSPSEERARCLSRAKEALEKLRNGSTRYEQVIHSLRYDLKAGGLSLADVGTSEDELTKLQIEDAQISARRRLDIIRSNVDDFSSINYDFWRRHLNESVKNGGLTLAALGTSEKELNELEIKGRIWRASRRIESLRRELSKGHDSYLDFAGIRGAVKRGEYTFKDIGTSEADFRELEVRNVKYSARDILDKLRVATEHAYLLHEASSSLKKFVIKHGLSLEEVGTNEEEIRQLEVKAVKLFVEQELQILKRDIDRFPESCREYAKKMLGVLEEYNLSLKDFGKEEEFAALKPRLEQESKPVEKSK